MGDGKICVISYGGYVCSKQACEPWDALASPLSVCVPLSFISFFVEHAEDVESKEAKEEADDDKGRPNGVQSSIMMPLAVTVQLHVSAMLCLCNAQGIRSILESVCAPSIKISLWRR